MGLASDLERFRQAYGNQGSASAYRPTLADKMASGLGTILQRLGINDRSARQFGARATAALANLTPVGAVTEGQEAKRSAQSGHYLAAAGHGMSALLSALPDGGASIAHAAPAAATGLGAMLHSIIAPLWHGSPHKFEKFALEKIGTGEGAQAYGHGLYFAENPETARAYQENVKDMGMVRDVNARMTELSRFMSQHEIPGQYGKYRTPEAQEAAAEYHRLMDQRSAKLRDPGHLYEVKLDANPEDFLNWDAPLGQQPQVAQGLASLGLDQGRWRGSDAGMPGDLAYHTVVEGSKRPNTVGLVADYNARIAATQRLNEAGIKGIRYLDQGSRGAGQGTHNYVVFDPSIIDILARY